jgi:hypothetical protein
MTAVKFGDCIVRSETDLTGRVAPVIVTADDHILVADGFLEELIDFTFKEVPFMY